MKKEKRKYILGKNYSNRAFFMPTIMIYIIIFISFTSFMVTDIYNYQKSMLLFKQDIILNEIELDLSKYISNNRLINRLNKCVSPKNHKSIKKNNYSISIWEYCLRTPNITSAVPESAIIAPLLATFKSGESLIDLVEYKSKEAQLKNISKIQNKHEWIGIPIDGTKIPEYQLAHWAIVMAMERNYIYDIKLKYNNIKYDIMIILNLDNNKIEKIFYTK